MLQSNPYEDRPNEAALLEKRSEYIYKAYQEVINDKKTIEEIIKSCQQTQEEGNDDIIYHTIVSKVRRMLKEHHGLNLNSRMKKVQKQNIPLEKIQKAEEEFEDEYPIGDVRDVVEKYVGNNPSEFIDSLKEKK